MAVRLLTVLNQTTANQNFLLISDPGTVTTIPNIAPPRPLIWRTAVTPALFGQQPSRAVFSWEDDFSLSLGIIKRAGTPCFVASTLLPMTEAEGNRADIGFVGTPANGALKVEALRHQADGRLGFSTESGVPGAAVQRAAGTVYAAAFGIGGVPCLALEAGPNLSVTLQPTSSIGIVAAGLDIAPGELALPSLLEAVFPLDFGSGGAIHLAFGADNLFRAL